MRFAAHYTRPALRPAVRSFLRLVSIEAAISSAVSKGPYTRPARISSIRVLIYSTQPEPLSSARLTPACRSASSAEEAPFSEPILTFFRSWTLTAGRTMMLSRGTSMILRFAMLLAGSVLIGQAQTGQSLALAGSEGDSTVQYERLRALQFPARIWHTGEALKFQFPPELWATGDQGNFGRRSTSYCASRSLETGALVFRRCLLQNRIRLVPITTVQPQNTGS